MIYIWMGFYIGEFQRLWDCLALEREGTWLAQQHIKQDIIVEEKGKGKIKIKIITYQDSTLHLRSLDNVIDKEVGKTIILLSKLNVCLLYERLR